MRVSRREPRPAKETPESDFLKGRVVARNMEVKARLSERQFAELRERVLGMTLLDRVLVQTDTFFQATFDRLKLRQFDGSGGRRQSAELIAYTRADQTQAKMSDYVRTPIEHPELLKESLERSIGIRGVVEKRRELYLVGQTRIHLDEVSNLGYFVELEVVLADQQSQGDGQRIADELVVKLGIQPESFISCAYIDLLEDVAGQKANLSS